MSIRPLADRVFVRQREAESTSSGGIILPGNAADKPNQGDVIRSGSPNSLAASPSSRSVRPRKWR
ncbi:hypothetical protein [Pseudohaliea rubra]|uniref:hypothetical protein n=1 Tax=Pseudohaliea rubra TaxID=475795 RepID=UPI000A05FEF1